MPRPLLIPMLLLTVLARPADAREEIAGPVEARILKIVDGDTILVEAQPWPQQKVEVYVRIRGIDAPELKSSCQDGRQAGVEARLALQDLAQGVDTVQLTRISGDKYFGRIVADVRLPDGKSAADDLLSSGVVRIYDGGRKPGWTCGS